jgi:hypothetical protein
MAAMNPLELEYRLEVWALIGAPIDLGETRSGHRRVIPITGGSVEGDGIKGTVIAGGADWQVVYKDGGADLEARYTLKTEDGALIQVTNRGMRRGDPVELAKLNRGEQANMDKIYFRTVATFETSAQQYQWLADALFIGVGERFPDRVHVHFYRVG